MTLNFYQQMIADDTGETDHVAVLEIEERMRAFAGGVLDHLTRAEFRTVARAAATARNEAPSEDIEDFLEIYGEVAGKALDQVDTTVLKILDGFKNFSDDTTRLAHEGIAGHLRQLADNIDNAGQ